MRTHCSASLFGILGTGQSPLHQHLFSLRLDWQLDGAKNTLLEEEVPALSDARFSVKTLD